MMKRIITIMALLALVSGCVEVPKEQLGTTTTVIETNTIITTTTISTTATAIAPTTNFTLIVLPDTQIYSASYPAVFTNQTQWIVNNKDTLNIVFVVHVGDVVDNCAISAQWTNANTSMSILDDNNIPYLISPGNHDDEDNFNWTTYNKYFNHTRFESYDYYGGHYPDDGGENTYGYFNASGMDFLLVFVSFFTSPACSHEELAWANSTVENNSDRRVIYTTHDYLKPDGTIDSPCGLHQWNGFIKWHEMIFLTLNGHHKGGNTGANLTSTGVNGNEVNQLFVNFQDQANGGDGYLRIMEFIPDENRIDVKTYSPYQDTYHTESYNQFNISYNMSASASSSLPETDTHWYDIDFARWGEL